MIDSSRVFTDDDFIYLLLFVLTYIRPMRYVLYREYDLLTKTSWNGLLPFSLLYADRITKPAATRIHIYGSASLFPVDYMSVQGSLVHDVLCL